MGETTLALIGKFTEGEIALTVMVIIFLGSLLIMVKESLNNTRDDPTLVSRAEKIEA